MENKNHNLPNEDVSTNVALQISQITDNIQKSYTGILKLLQTEELRKVLKDNYLDDLHDISKQLFNIMNKLN